MGQVRYAKTGDVHIAYQVVGEGPMDLVFVPGFVSNGPFKVAVVQPVWLWAGWVRAIGTKLTAPQRG